MRAAQSINGRQTEENSGFNQLQGYGSQMIGSTEMSGQGLTGMQG
jgi:hypothetical protein